MLFNKGKRLNTLAWFHLLEKYEELYNTAVKSVPAWVVMMCLSVLEKFPILLGYGLVGGGSQTSGTLSLLIDIGFRD